MLPAPHRLLDCGSEEGEAANNIEHAQARRATILPGMNFECGRRGMRLQRRPETGGLGRGIGRRVALAVFCGKE